MAWRLGWSEASRKFGLDNNGEDEERASEEDEDMNEEAEEHRSNRDGATFGPEAWYSESFGWSGKGTG